MKVRKAETAGFCFGVKRAVDMTESLAEKEHGPLYTWGPIVHNDSVTEELERKGVSVLSQIPEDGVRKDAVVVIRAHGVSEATEEQLNTCFGRVVDATCPFVKKIHRVVREYSEKGYTILVFGDAAHPEVIGIAGRCRGPYFVVQTAEEALQLVSSPDLPVCVVAQTTFNAEKFKKSVEILENRLYNCLIVNTVCNATRERQREAALIAEESDMMIVIGSRSSSNSQKLYDICKNKCNRTYFIQTVNDLSEIAFDDVESVGITAGASTPEKIIEEVQTNVGKF